MVFFVVRTVWDNLSGNVSINVLFDLFQPLVFLVIEVLLAKIDQIDNLLSSYQSVGVKKGDLLTSPVPIANPFVLV